MPDPTDPSDARPVPSADATPWWRTIALAAVLGSVGSLAVAVVARPAGIELSVPDQVNGGAMALPVAVVVVATIIATVLAGGLAIALTGFAARPRATFLTTTIATTLASFILVYATEVPIDSQHWLAAMHVAVAVVVIPLLARRSPIRRTGRSAPLAASTRGEDA